MTESQHQEQFETISPVEFEPSRGRREESRWEHVALLSAVFLALLLLVVGAWYLFTSRSVQIAVTPVPETMDLDGGLLRLNLGDRWLLRPGDYQLQAGREGYYPLQHSITVSQASDQLYQFELKKLPGHLSVRGEPAGATVLVDGEILGEAPIASHQLEPGAYQLRVQADRYQRWEAPLEIVGLGEHQTVSYRLDPNWGVVSLDSSPAGATLHVDGEPVGETPLRTELLAGRHQMELRLDGYKPWASPIDIDAMENIQLPRVDLEQADHRVHLSSAPGGASVTVDGEYRGQTPMHLDLRPGDSYRIVFSKPGYRSNERRLEVLEGDETELAVRLTPVLGTVTVEGTPEHAEVYVDGRRRGSLNQPLELPAHPHRIEVRSEGFEPYRATVTPNPDLEKRIEVALVSDAERQRQQVPEVLDTAIAYQLKLFRPSGIVQMGSPRREQGRRSNEFMRQVQLQRPFYMGFREVSNEQFMQFRASHDSGVIERQTLSLKNQPAVRVSWEEAARFCNWLSQREGLPPAYRDVQGRMTPVSPMTTGYRLPTEAEWVLIARYEGQPEGRPARKYTWGDDMPPPQGAGNLAGEEATDLVDPVLQGYQDPYAATAPVGSFSPDAAGLFDLSGNVSEWMHDYYLIRVGGLGSIPVDPMGPEDGESHVVRGASWRSGGISELRLAWRADGNDARVDIGFRIARYAE